jgi:hypothetical protein
MGGTRGRAIPPISYLESERERGRDRVPQFPLRNTSHMAPPLQGFQSPKVETKPLTHRGLYGTLKIQTIAPTIT